MVIYTAHKTITISVEAYDALKRAKEDYESFTDIILRMARKKERSGLLDYLNSIGPQPELADLVEAARKARNSRKRRVVL